MKAPSPQPRITSLVDKLSLRDTVSPEEIEALEDVLDAPRNVAAGSEIVREHSTRCTAPC